MPDAPLPVIINRSGGTASALGAELETAVRDAFAAAGREIDLRLVEAAAIERELEEVAAAGLVAVGGGDGTLGQAAGLLARAGCALAILPLGTRNHLARQLGLPGDLAEVAKVIAAGRTMRIDLGRAGERVFVNNTSLGLYSRLVRLREAMAVPKRYANLAAAWHVLRHLRAQPLGLEIDGEPHHVTTPLLFIGNNRYSLEGSAVGTRESLSDGRLSFYAVAARTPLQLVAMALRTLVGRADPERDFIALEEGRSAIISGRRSLDVACDGEVARMTLPLEVSSWPLALDVVVP